MDLEIDKLKKIAIDLLARMDDVKENDSKVIIVGAFNFIWDKCK